MPRAVLMIMFLLKLRVKITTKTILFLLFTTFVIGVFATQTYNPQLAKFKLIETPFKIEGLLQIARSRLNSRTTEFKFPFMILQYHLPFQYIVIKKNDTICSNYYCNALLSLRPVVFYYGALNYDFGTGMGIKISNKIFKKFYWSYQLSLGWFEGQSVRGIRQGINFMHLLGLSYSIKPTCNIFINGGHISNGGIFGRSGSLQDFFGAGLSYSFIKKIKDVNP